MAKDPCAQNQNENRGDRVHDAQICSIPSNGREADRYGQGLAVGHSYRDAQHDTHERIALLPGVFCRKERLFQEGVAAFLEHGLP